MDLPPIKLEMVRLGLAGQRDAELCRPAMPGQLVTSLQGRRECVQATRIQIVEPPTHPQEPPLMPPPPPLP